MIQTKQEALDAIAEALDFLNSTAIHAPTAPPFAVGEWKWGVPPKNGSWYLCTQQPDGPVAFMANPHDEYWRDWGGTGFSIEEPQWYCAIPVDWDKNTTPF